MDAWRSTRSCSRGRRSRRERGYALISALVLAILYFGLIELLLLDASRELSEARRFRARIVAETLAESAAELAAKDIVNQKSANGTAEDWQGAMRGEMTKNESSGQFDIVGYGTSGGIDVARARVFVRGRVVKGDVRINYTQHTSPEL